MHSKIGHLSQPEKPPLPLRLQVLVQRRLFHFVSDGDKSLALFRRGRPAFGLALGRGKNAEANQSKTDTDDSAHFFSPNAGNLTESFFPVPTKPTPPQGPPFDCVHR